MDIDRSQGNVQLQVVASCCHCAHLSQGKASWEAGVRGVTPSIDDDHTRAPAKQAAGPVLLLWSHGILLHSSNITALTEQTSEGARHRGSFPLEHTAAVCLSLSLYLLAILSC